MQIYDFNAQQLLPYVSFHFHILGLRCLIRPLSFERARAEMGESRRSVKILNNGRVSIRCHSNVHRAHSMPKRIKIFRERSECGPYCCAFFYFI